MRKVDHTGESRINNQGLKMTIVAYRSGHDIDVQFEDGRVVTNKYYGHFVMGKIRNPYYKSHLGETRVNNQGVKMTIVEWRSAIDIDIQFEDGQIKKTRYEYFRDGTVSHHKYHINSTQEKNKLYKVGEQVFNTQKQKMTLVAYRSYSDIDVQFEDGSIKTHIGYKEFKKGWVHSPSHVSHSSNIVNTEKLATCGIYMTAQAVKSYLDVTVAFATGYITHSRVGRFESGNIRHPFPYQIGNITMRSPAYIYNNEGNFYCFCNKCKKSDIMTVQEMKDHKCIASNE